MTDFLQKNRNEAKSVPTWVQGRDLNPRPPGYHFVPVAVVCRVFSPVRLYPLALWATPLTKTIHRIVFASLTQRATLVGLITLSTKKNEPNRFAIMWVQGRDLNPRPPGYEPDELPNCSTLRYLIGAGDRDRTGTGLKSHRILSPGRLPVPPLRRASLGQRLR